MSEVEKLIPTKRIAESILRISNGEVSTNLIEQLATDYLAADKEIATKDAELARLRKELEKIENPMRYLQEYAAETGTSIDEIAAKQLSNDADWLKGIAWEALHNDS